MKILRPERKTVLPGSGLRLAFDATLGGANFGFTVHMDSPRSFFGRENRPGAQIVKGGTAPIVPSFADPFRRDAVR